MTNYRRLYDRMAPFYGVFWERVRPWYRYTQRVLPQLPETGAVLEIGPGPGVLHQDLSKRYPLAIGFDLSPAMLAATQNRLLRMRLVPHLVRGNAIVLPFAGESFDAITMTFVFSAIPEGPQAMAEFYRVLRPGGRIVLVDAGVPDDGNRGGVLMARAWELFGDYMREESDLMQAAGFQLQKREMFGALNGIRLVVGEK